MLATLVEAGLHQMIRLRQDILSIHMLERIQVVVMQNAEVTISHANSQKAICSMHGDHPH